MTISETNLKGCFEIQPTVLSDDRGLFFEAYHKAQLEEAIGYPVFFVQDNQSVSKKGVLRGLHYQSPPFAQAKLVSVTVGEVLDVIVDLRIDSPTFGQHIKVKLTGENGKSIFIPKGMAHGFVALGDTVIFRYKCDYYYNKASEKGIIYNDPTLGIDWEVPETELILSDKDRLLPNFNRLF